MSISTGQQALIRRIVTMTTDANIVLPNGSTHNLPRYVVQSSGGSQRSLGASGLTEAFPEIVVRVETVADAYATQNDQLVAALVARFSVGDVFDGVEITEAPLPRAPLGMSEVYSVPVIIRGRMVF
jgi:hypothetical protein